MTPVKYITQTVGQVVFTVAVCVTTWCFSGDIQKVRSTTPTAIVRSTETPQLYTDSKVTKWIKFQHLVKQWKGERGARSSITETAIMPSYLNIIGMGEAAVPFILAQLRLEGKNPDQWFLALQAITRANPVDPKDQGDFSKMARAWMKWGAEYDAG